MNGPDILSSFRDQLAQELQAYEAPPTPEHLPISPWLAMSLLQKAVRRREHQLAQSAAYTLLQIAPDRLWRRTGVIAFEDVGVADIEAVSLVTGALAGKTVRSRIGNEWEIASYLVSRLTSARKCRSADDLLVLAHGHPAYAEARKDLALLPTQKLIESAIAPGSLPDRAIALWYAAGTSWGAPSSLHKRRGEPQLLFDQLCDAGLPETVVEIAREGYRKVGEMLCPFLPLLWAMRSHEDPVFEDDDLGPDIMLGATPSWCIDLFTREGRRALELFLAGESRTARWVREHVPRAQRVRFLGMIVFWTEGGLMRARLQWDIGRELRTLAETGTNGGGVTNAAEVLSFMRGDIALLNGARRHAL